MITYRIQAAINLSIDGHMTEIETNKKTVSAELEQTQTITINKYKHPPSTSMQSHFHQHPTISSLQVQHISFVHDTAYTMQLRQNNMTCISRKNTSNKIIQLSISM